MSYRKKINTKRELFIAVLTVILIIGGLIGRLIITGDVKYIVTSIEKEFSENKEVYDSINNWSNSIFIIDPQKKHPFKIIWDRADQTCSILDGNNNFINLGEKDFLKRIYHFYDKSSVEAINIYHDVIIYHLDYGTTTIIHNKPYRIEYSLVYFKNKKTQRYKNYRLYKKGEIPDPKIRWLYNLEGNWYIKNHLRI